MPGAFQEWHWFNRDPTPEQVMVTVNALIFLREALQQDDQPAWAAIVADAIKELRFYAERERQN